MRSSQPAGALPLAAAVAGLWAVLPPFVGPSLAVPSDVETADHVVPGAAVVALAAAVLAVGRGRVRLVFLAGLAVALAGVWTVATHAALVVDAVEGRVGAGAALHHAAPGPVVLALGVAWTLAVAREAPAGR